MVLENQEIVREKSSEELCKSVETLSCYSSLKQP